MGSITASRTQLRPDPVYGSLLASKFINCLMEDGKKSVAVRVTFTAPDRVLTDDDVARVRPKIEKSIKQQLGKKGPGEFVIPGLVKLRVVDKPAQPEREGINPATREKIVIKAKPASRKVRLTALKTLKTMVG